MSIHTKWFNLRKIDSFLFVDLLSEVQAFGEPHNLVTDMQQSFEEFGVDIVDADDIL